MISLYECRAACISNNYNWSTWLELDEWERAYCIAYDRVHDAMESNVTDAYTRYQERQTRRARGRR